MKRSIFLSCIVASICLIATVACKNSEAKKFSEVVISKDSLVKRGSYLVSSVGCDDCHSPKKVGPNGAEIIPELRLSGFRQDGTVPSINKAELQKGWILFAPDLTSAVGPWGESFAANLTSDETGIGNWSEAQFRKAIREGKYKGMDNTRPLLPPMPWFVYRNFSDDDIKAIYTFLQTTKPVNNVVPAYKKFEDLK